MAMNAMCFTAASTRTGSDNYHSVQRRQWRKKGGKQSVTDACSRITNAVGEWIERVEMSSEVCLRIIALLIDCIGYNSASGTPIGRRKDQNK